MLASLIDRFCRLSLWTAARPVQRLAPPANVDARLNEGDVLGVGNVGQRKAEFGGRNASKSTAIFAFHDTENIRIVARQDALAMREADLSETSFLTKNADRSINR